MRVLVTGANGFVGTPTCARLLSAGVEVIAAVRRQPATLPPGVAPVIVGEIDETTMWEEAFRGVSAVVHLAARVHVAANVSRNSPDEFRRVNVEGTAHLARRAAASGVRRFVFVSSVKVHGEGRSSPYTEKDAAAPEDAYARSKWEAEQELRAIERETGLEVAIVRPPLVYGPGVRANFLKLMELLHKRAPLPFKSVRNRRSLVFVSNLADALATCLTHPAAAGQTFLVSDGDDRSTPDLIRQLGEAMHLPVTLLPVPVAWLRGVGLQALVGARGFVHDDLSPKGFVRVQGELWSAQALPADQMIVAGTEVEIVSAEHMTVFVRTVGPD